MFPRLRAIAAGLTSAEIWLLAALITASVISARVLPAVLVTAAVFWLIRWVAFGRPSIRTPADWAIALLLLMVPVTFWVTAWPDTTTPQVYRLLGGIALYYA